jgi:hypothetical protein
LTIVIRVGRLPEILWALVTLTGFVLASSGVFNVLSGASALGENALADSFAVSHLSGGVLMFCFGLIAIAARVSWNSRKNNHRPKLVFQKNCFYQEL